MPVPLATIAALAAGVSALANSVVNIQQSVNINKNRAMAARNRGEIVKYDKYRRKYYTYK